MMTMMKNFSFQSWIAGWTQVYGVVMTLQPNLNARLNPDTQLTSVGAAIQSMSMVTALFQGIVVLWVSDT
jgi:hypothetical protein